MKIWFEVHQQKSSWQGKLTSTHQLVNISIRMGRLDCDVIVIEGTQSCPIWA